MESPGMNEDGIEKRSEHGAWQTPPEPLRQEYSALLSDQR